MKTKTVPGRSNPIGRILSVFLAIALVFTGITVPKDIFAESRDVSDLLKSLEIKVNDKKPEGVIELNENQQIKLLVTMKVPVSLDFPDEDAEAKKDKVVKAGDKASILLGKGLSNFGTSAKKAIIITSKDGKKPLKLGEYQFVTRGDDLYVDITFTESGVEGENIFADYEGVEAGIEGNFSVDLSKIPLNPTEDTKITILNKEYILKAKRPADQGYIEKTGEIIPSKQTVRWTVTVSSDSKIMNDFTFSDNLENVGEYEADSFKFEYTAKDGSKHTVKPKAPYNSKTKVLSHTFAKDGENDIVAPAKITFETKMSDEQLLPQTVTYINNTAKLEKEGSKTVESKAYVKWEKAAITKKFVETKVEGGNVFLIWKITTNEAKAKVDNVKITERLTGRIYTASEGVTGYEVEYHSAKMLFYDEDDKLIESKTRKFAKSPSSGEEELPKPDAYNSAVFNVGSIDGKVELEVTTKVKNPAGLTTNGKINSRKLLKNDASFSWGTKPIYRTVSVREMLGNKAITKTPVDKNKNVIDYLNFITTWRIQVSKDNVTPDATAYDMLIFDNDAKEDDVRNFRLGEASDAPKTIDGISLEALKPQELQYFQYIDGKHSQPNGKNNVKVTSKKIYLTKKFDGVNETTRYIGDLVIMKNFGSDEDERTVYIDSRTIKKPNIINNYSSRLPNTAYLYEGSHYIDLDTAYVYYDSEMLFKANISRDQATRFDKEPTALNANVTNVTPGNWPYYKKNSFNYDDKTITYRLSVNGREVFDLGDGEVIDQLPKSLELEKYTIFKGKYNRGGPQDLRVSAVGEPILVGDNEQKTDEVEVVITPADENNGQKITFKFPKIKNAYVIMLKTKLKDEAFKEYLEKGEKVTITNDALVSLGDITGGANVKSEVEIEPKATFKQYEFSSLSPAELKWSIDYLPYGVIKEKTAVIKDVLGENIELRHGDEKDSLIFKNEDGTKNFQIFDLKLNADGTVTPGEETKDIKIEDYISYDYASRTLKFKVPDHTKAYRFAYVTDITGAPGAGVTNTATLEETSLKQNYDTKVSYTIGENSAYAIATKSAFIEITKKAKDGALLEGAKFKLKSKDGTKYYEKELATNKNGKVQFRGIPVGDYILKETQAPQGYWISEKEYEVKVVKAGAVLMATVGDTKTNKVSIENIPTTEPNPDPKDQPKPNPNPNTTPDPNKPPVTPPENPTTPTTPTTPRTPNRPVYPRGNTPNPNDPSSPNEITVIDDNGVPLGNYKKHQNPDGTVEYQLVDEAVPLGLLPKTGDDFAGAYHMGGFSLIVCGLGIALVEIRRRKQSKKI